MENNNAILNMDISLTSLSTKTKKMLNNIGIYTVKDLVEKRLIDIQRIRNVGNVTIDEIKAFLLDNGLSFKSEGTIIDDYNNGIELPLEELLSQSILNIGLSTSVCHPLVMFGNIRTVKDLVNKETREIAELRNIGSVGVSEILTKLHELGLYLKDERRNLQQSCLSISEEFKLNPVLEESMLLEKAEELSSEKTKCQVNLFEIEKELLLVEKRLNELRNGTTRK